MPFPEDELELDLDCAAVCMTESVDRRWIARICGRPTTSSDACEVKSNGECGLDVPWPNGEVGVDSEGVAIPPEASPDESTKSGAGLKSTGGGGGLFQETDLRWPRARAAFECCC